MNNVIPNKKIIVDCMLNMYNSMDKTSQYDQDLINISKEIGMIEEKKSLAFDMVYNGEISREALKSKFEILEKNLCILKKRYKEILNHKNVLEKNTDNIEKLSKSIWEEITGGYIEEFIRKFIDEIIVNKIDNDRNNITLDIFLNLFGTERCHTKGVKHINGPTDDDIIYLEKQKYISTEKRRIKDRKNQFIYNVYVRN